MSGPPRVGLPRRRTPRFMARGLLLYVLTLPLVFAFVLSMLRLDFRDLAVSGAALLLFAWAASLARGGMRAEAEYLRRRIAAPPRVPRKALGAALLSLTVAGTAYLGAGFDPWISAGLGAGTGLGFVLCYGLDPRAVKGLDAGSFGAHPDEVVEAIREAEQAIARIEAANRRIRCHELSRRLERITALARHVVALVEENPRDLRRARRFLNVYLTGAQRVTEGYARTHRRTPSRELESSFRNVLDTIERVFAEQREKLLAKDVLDVDVQIEVLSKQLEREGVA